jgi:PPM family protein phosphatase
MTDITHAVITHVGNVRGHNEDSYFADDQLKLWLVADGMGGHAGGEIASALAVDIVSRRVAEGDGLADAIEAGHRAILEAVENGNGKPGMGTTIVALRVVGDEYEIGWVGDSRIYHWNGERLKQLSIDHSYVQMLVDLGKILPQEARFHPQKNVITQNLGAEHLDRVLVGLRRGNLEKGHKILLCSDGLSDELDDRAIEIIIQSGGSDKTIVDNLLTSVLEGNARDNITVVLVSAN